VALLSSMERRTAAGVFNILGLPAGASADEAKRAFFALTKTYHPHRFSRFSQSTQDRANRTFLTIKKAYDEVQRSNPSADSSPKIVVGRSGTTTVPPALAITAQGTAVASRVPIAASAATQDTTPAGAVVRTGY